MMIVVKTYRLSHEHIVPIEPRAFHEQPVDIHSVLRSTRHLLWAEWHHLRSYKVHRVIKRWRVEKWG